MSAFDELQKHYGQRDLAARKWKEKGGRVVGYLCNNVPEEFILAAGLFPLRLSGDPRGDTEKIGNYSEQGNVFSREGFVASILHMLLRGKYDFLDYLVIPHARDSVHRLYTRLVNQLETEPELNLPELYYLDSLHSKFYSAGIYNRERWLELKKQLEKWAGQEISRDKISSAIDVTNENKSLLKKTADLRAAARISGVDALQIIGSSMLMHKEEHNKLLKEYLAGAGEFPQKNGTRLFVEGSPLDNLQLYEIIESCQATVVAEDNCWGNRSFDVPIDTAADPLEAVINRYNNYQRAGKPGRTFCHMQWRRLRRNIECNGHTGHRHQLLACHYYDQKNGGLLSQYIKGEGLPRHCFFYGVGCYQWITNRRWHPGEDYQNPRSLSAERVKTRR